MRLFFRKAFTWWTDLSIFNRLYAVVGVMALLIAMELLTLRFAMGTLSAVRAFVGGEGLWSKAQKTAVSNLEKYVLTGNEQFFNRYRENLKVPLGDHKARLAMELPTPDIDLVYQGFIEGRIHPQDVEGLVHLFRRFHDNQYLARAIALWKEADVMMAALMADAEDLHTRIQSRKMSRLEVSTTLERLENFDAKLTKVEDEFSYALGEGSRWLESTVLSILFLAVLTIEGTGIYLTFSFSRYLSRGLKGISKAADSIGQGRFETRMPVQSQDELGRLASSINQMATALKENVGERHQAEVASQWKSLFLANMSHEIRTPLGAILGFTELLQEPTLPIDERQKYHDIVRRTGESLNKIVNDILDLSKVEAGRLEFERVNFDFAKFIDDIHDVLSIKAKEKNIQLTFKPRGGQIPFIRTDPVRLRQILINMVSNAIKFSPENGFVALTYEFVGQRLQFLVHDSGPGIPENQRSKLFQPFSQMGNNQKTGGTGLGLFLSQKLANALGGDIQLLDNFTHQGSIFVVTVWIEAAQAPAAERNLKIVTDATQEALLVGKKILLVDDTPENLTLIERLLVKRGAKVFLAANGKEGVDRALENSVDLILMDMMMPVMNGYEATKALRLRGFENPIIAVTAHAMKEDREKCLESGCDEYITKPIQSWNLIQVVAEQLEKSRQARSNISS